MLGAIGPRLQPSYRPSHLIPTESAPTSHAVPTGRNRDAILLGEQVEHIAHDYFARNASPAMATVAAAAARHQDPKDALTAAVVRLGLFVNGAGARLANEISQLPVSANVPDDLPAFDQGQARALIDNVRQEAKGWNPSHPDYGPTTSLNAALDQVQQALTTDAIDTQVYLPAVRAMQQTDGP